MGEHTDGPTDQIIREIVNDGYYESAEYISEEETVAMAHEILELRRCKARLKNLVRTLIASGQLEGNVYDAACNTLYDS